MEYPHLKNFDPQVCISGKVNRIARATANIFRRHLLPFSITSSQLSLLFILIKHGPLTQVQLCKMAVLEKSTLNRNLKRLEENSLITRHDFRQINVTRQGKQFTNDIIPAWRAAMDEIKALLHPEGEQALSLIHNKIISR